MNKIYDLKHLHDFILRFKHSFKMISNHAIFCKLYHCFYSHNFLIILESSIVYLNLSCINHFQILEDYHSFYCHYHEI